jgi:hypothetical protein
MQNAHLRALEVLSSTLVGGDIMKYKVAADYTARTNGSCFKGAVEVTYGELIMLFGKPSCGESGDGKVQAEWIVTFKDGRMCTIYDWKEYDTPVGGVTNWHLGGHDNIAPNRIKEIIKNGISS